MIIPRLRAPVVLVHGLLGFDRLQVGNWVLADYFPGIPEALRAAGNRVLVARLSPTGGIADRAGQLKDLIDRESPHEPVHLFGHSMGGLDSRYLISRLGMAGRVLSLTTLGTPHRGSPFADWALRHFGHFFSPVLEFIGIPYQAVRDLTVASCRAFNESAPDAPAVRYFSVAGRFRPDWLAPEWQLPAAILEKAEGPNDGVVSVESARYGEGCEIWDDDHLGLVNFRHPLRKAFRPAPDRVAHYAGLVRRLADEGF
jgi:triacylglycerol lipase